jgi:hypothetical protein
VPLYEIFCDLLIHTLQTFSKPHARLPGIQINAFGGGKGMHLFYK